MTNSTKRKEETVKKREIAIQKRSPLRVYLCDRQDLADDILELCTGYPIKYILETINEVVIPTINEETIFTNTTLTQQ